MEIKDYRPFTKEEFLAAGFNPLYPFVGKGSPSGKKLTTFMEKIGLGEEERNVIGTLVWLNAQEGGTKGPMNAMHLFDGLLKGFDQLQEMMRIVQEYMNNVPKLIFKGYHPTRCSKSRISSHFLIIGLKLASVWAHELAVMTLALAVAV